MKVHKSWKRYVVWSRPLFSNYPTFYIISRTHYSNFQTVVAPDTPDWINVTFFISQKLPGMSDCDLCPAGYYCDAGSGPVVNFDNYTCPEGYYCPNGTEQAQQYPCPIQTFNNRTGELHSLEHVCFFSMFVCLDPPDHLFQPRPIRIEHINLYVIGRIIYIFNHRPVKKCWVLLRPLKLAQYSSYDYLKGFF